eukprot:TRINITY_DN467_c0_g1_i1.p1 TRINITY_DN467_c0_g1~~TRINITY_DN467_c0_g1_i1.p1  ORF type:complete len:259 (+),score=15.46 TRINITY_DN467_c0_g1_i1:35-811(+)
MMNRVFLVACLLGISCAAVYPAWTAHALMHEEGRFPVNVTIFENDRDPLASMELIVHQGPELSLSVLRNCSGSSVSEFAKFFNGTENYCHDEHSSAAACSPLQDLFALYELANSTGPCVSMIGHRGDGYTSIVNAALGVSVSFCVKTRNWIETVPLELSVSSPNLTFSRTSSASAASPSNATSALTLSFYDFAIGAPPPAVYSRPAFCDAPAPPPAPTPVSAPSSPPVPASRRSAVSVREGGANAVEHLLAFARRVFA